MTVAQDDKGALLYNPKRAVRDRRLGIIVGLVFAVIFGVLTVLMTLAIIRGEGKFSTVEPPLRYLGLVIPVMFVVLTAMFVVLPFRFMPFRVYEGGVTRTRVPFRDGLAGREAFVPAGEIAKVTWESEWVFRVGDVEGFRFDRLDGESFDVGVDDGDEERVTGLLRQVLRCEVEGPEGR